MGTPVQAFNSSFYPQNHLRSFIATQSIDFRPARRFPTLFFHTYPPLHAFISQNGCHSYQVPARPSPLPSRSSARPTPASSSTRSTSMSSLRSLLPTASLLCLPSTSTRVVSASRRLRVLTLLPARLASRLSLNRFGI